MLDKDELLFYRQIHTTLKPLHLWEVARRNPLEKTSIATLVHIICGNTPMRFKSWLIQDDDNEERCKFCYAPPWNTSFHFIMLCQHFNSWRNKWWDEIVDKFTVELNAKLFSLDDIEMYECIISGTFRLKHLTTSTRDQFLIINAKNISALIKQQLYWLHSLFIII